MVILINISQKESKWFPNILKASIDNIISIQPPTIYHNTPTAKIESDVSMLIENTIKHNIENISGNNTVVLIYIDVERTFDDILKREIRKMFSIPNLYFANINYSGNKIVGWRTFK